VGGDLKEAGEAGSIPGWGNKILHASGHSQKKKKGRFVDRCRRCDDDSNNLESWEEEATRPGMQCWFLQENQPHETDFRLTSGSRFIREYICAV